MTRIYRNRITHYLSSAYSTWRQEGMRSVWNKFVMKLKRESYLDMLLEEDGQKTFPQVSIVIPVYNALAMTKACLESIYRTAGDVDFEILVIDNASSDETPKWLKTQQSAYSNLKVFRMERNTGFGPAVNHGLRYSKGEFVVILNNDTIVTHNWLKNLLTIMQTNLEIGIVSPVTNYLGEGPQIDRNSKDLPPNLDFIDNYARTLIGQTDIIYEPNRLVFFCVLLRRELLDLIGYLDEGYEKGNFEDDDYCMRTRMAGYRLAIARNSFVYHHGTVTFKVNRISHSQWMDANRRYYYQKVGRISSSLRPRLPILRTNKALIDVIIRTKNRPGLLRKALTSLVNQTYQGFEVILVNDGGEDVTPLIAEFQSYYSIRYVANKTSLGRTAAINAGLALSQNEWIAYLDDDDILYPWHFESLIQTSAETEAGLIYGDYNRTLFNNSFTVYPVRLIGAPPWDYSRQELLVQNYLPIHSYIHKRKLIEKVGVWNEKFNRLEDYEFLLRMSSACAFYHVNKVTCEYRYYLDHENSISVGREEYLMALQNIYHKYPVEDRPCIAARHDVIEAIRDQIGIIRKLMENPNNLSLKKQEINRRIINIVAGM